VWGYNARPTAVEPTRSMDRQFAVLRTTRGARQPGLCQAPRAPMGPRASSSNATDDRSINLTSFSSL